MEERTRDVVPMDQSHDEGEWDAIRFQWIEDGGENERCGSHGSKMEGRVGDDQFVSDLGKVQQIDDITT